MHDTELARDATREDIEGGRDQYAQTLLLWGTMGWDGVDDAVDLGTSTNGATNLARVTLFVGKPPGLKAKPNIAQGHQVLVQLTGPVLALFPAGTQVQCSFPGGDIETPGNGTILNCRLSDQKAPNVGVGDVVAYAPGGFGNFTRWRADGRIEHSTHTADGNDADIFELIDPGDANGAGANGSGFPGFYKVAPWGTEMFNTTGWHLQTQWGASVDFGGWSDGGVLAAMGLTSTISFRASQCSVNAGLIKLGSGTGHQPIAISTTLAATTLTPLVAQVQALATAVVAVSGAFSTAVCASPGSVLTPTPPAGPGSLAAALAELTAVATALSALTTLISGATPLPFSSLTTGAT